MTRRTVRWAAVAALLVGVLLPSALRAHGGGTPRLTSVEAGPYRLYAWTEPEPWRVGEVHLSIAVTKPNPDGGSAQVELPVDDAQIQVTLTPDGDPGAAITVPGRRQTQLADIYYEADTVLPHAGLWQVKIAAVGADGTGEAGFALEAQPARTLNWVLVGAAGAVLVVLLILMAVWARTARPDAAQTARPRARRLQRG